MTMIPLLKRSGRVISTPPMKASETVSFWLLEEVTVMQRPGLLGTEIEFAAVMDGEEAGNEVLSEERRNGA